ncbi:MAG: magnesium/cobalt transporter CorA [Paludibacter sp.]|jgi:magnesium transporter|nr:magnesium/cobalt transporter CorA [Paludibacter sp.]
MSRYSKKKKEHIGLSPYALVFRGQQKTDSVRIRAIAYDSENVSEYEITDIAQLKTLKAETHRLWLQVNGLHEVELFERLASLFEIPADIVSDILNPSLRPKVQDFDKGFFTTVKMLQYDEQANTLAAENLSLLAIEGALISVTEESHKAFETVVNRILKHKSQIRTAEADYLAFALLDVVVDNYIYIVGLLGDDIEDLEYKTNSAPNDIIEEINHFKKEMNFLRKNIKPAKEMILALPKSGGDVIRPENICHYKELQDNINEATELADSYRELLYDISSTYHTSVSARLNDIMRILTIISVIFIPLTFIVGIYGTNFDYLPEIHWHYGYFAMLAVMVAIVALMLWFFKRKKWL